MTTLKALKLAWIKIIKYIIENQSKIDLCLHVISYEIDDAIDAYL